MAHDANENPLYSPIPDHQALRKALEEKLAEYNDSNAVMDLVLFQQAMEHVCRITRVLDQPRGNAMLVGVGGSGKQSLARLAAFICGYEVFQISVSSTYGINEFKQVRRGGTAAGGGGGLWGTHHLPAPVLPGHVGGRH